MTANWACSVDEPEIFHSKNEEKEDFTDEDENDKEMSRYSGRSHREAEVAAAEFEKEFQRMLAETMCEISCFKEERGKEMVWKTVASDFEPYEKFNYGMIVSITLSLRWENWYFSNSGNPIQK
jgi:hypothetical protein